MDDIKTPAKSPRIAAIDILRGLAIVGMILCANIGWDSDLPAWMFHAQVPPPDYHFSPDVPGITWVDLVFPFFLFSMGAAFPFALRKRIASGQKTSATILSLVRRWAILIVFSIVLGNGYRIGGAECSPVIRNLFSIAVWAGMFFSLTRFRFKKEIHNRTANICGILMITALAFAMQFGLGVELSKSSSNIIIMVLAYVALFGGIIWIVSKDSIKLRIGIFLGIGVIKGIASYLPEIFSFMPSPSSLGISWIFNWSFLQYLMIAIPGSIVGDMILGRISDGSNKESGKWETALSYMTLATVIFQLWGLFTRHVTADFIVTAASGIIFVAATKGSRHLWSDIVSFGYMLMLCGILFDPIDGGIKKDPCNLSYMLTTSGMAAIVTGFLLFQEFRFGMKAKWLSECGQNPMIAYTVTNFITNPILSLICVMPAINALTAGSPVMGVLRGILIVAIMMAITVFFTRKKLFWRS